MIKNINKKYVTHKREPFFQIACSLIESSSRVLDVGAGSGEFSRYCKRGDFYLYEGNLKSVEYLKKKNKFVFHGELPKLPFGDHYFDVIHCSHVIEHLDSETFYATLKEIDRCLKDSGYLIISAPLLWDHFFDDLSHVRPYTPTVLINYLGNNDASNRTRVKISNKYKSKKIVYRYRKIPLLQNIANTKESFGVKIFMKAVNRLEKLGLEKYEKTGFTIVLQK